MFSLHISLKQLPLVSVNVQVRVIEAFENAVVLVGAGHPRKSLQLVHHVKAQYLDEYTREVLPEHLVRAAIVEELEYCNKVVWELDDAKAVLGNKDSKVIRTRWVMCNKGDAAAPDVRARLVA